MTAVRVWDSDLVHPDHAPALNALCLDLLIEYNGNWDALVEWKRHLLIEQRDMSAKDVRQVLNMLSTTSPETADRIRAALPERRSVASEVLPDRLRRESTAYPPKAKPKRVMRVFGIDGRATFKVDFGYIDTEMGRIHLIDHTQSTVRWQPSVFPEGGWDFDNRLPAFDMTWRCGRHQWPIRPGCKGTGIRLIVSPRDTEPYRPWCKNCLRIALAEGKWS